MLTLFFVWFLCKKIITVLTNRRNTQRLFRSLRESSIKPLGGLFISTPFEGGGGLFNLEKTMVLVLHKELKYEVEKLKYKKVGVHAAEDQNQIRTSNW